MHINNTAFVRKQKHLIVKKGDALFVLKIEEIALFYTSKKKLYAIDKHEKKYLINNILDQLELELDSSIFFRANNDMLININFVSSFYHQKIDLVVDMTLSKKFPVVIEKKIIPSFKKWITQF